MNAGITHTTIAIVQSNAESGAYGLMIIGLLIVVLIARQILGTDTQRRTGDLFRAALVPLFIAFLLVVFIRLTELTP